jgi:hypothetical protein
MVARAKHCMAKPTRKTNGPDFRTRNTERTRPESRLRDLTEYEAEQVQEIARWKSAPPNPVGELIKVITVPLARIVEQVVPDAVVRAAIEGAYDVADFAAGQEDIHRRAGVERLEDLRSLSLEDCDRLAFAVGLGAQGIGLVEGALTGSGGMATTAVDVPLLFTLAMRTIIKIGHSYGYPLESDADRSYVLQILIIGTSGSSETRLERIQQLRDVEDMAVEETQEEVVAEELLSFLFQMEEFGEIPGMGAISGGLLNYAFLRRVEVAARRSFQERWLRENRKVGVIQPAPVPEHVPSGSGLRGALTRLVYNGSYYVGYGVAWPIFITASLLPSHGSVANGVHEGAEAAARAVDRLVGSQVAGADVAVPALA